MYLVCGAAMIGSVPVAIEMWGRLPEAALDGYVSDDDKQHWQLRHPHSGLDIVELGYAIQQALEAENKGKCWYREDAIVGRAVKATSNMGFMDFLREVLPQT